MFQMSKSKARILAAINYIVVVSLLPFNLNSDSLWFVKIGLLISVNFSLLLLIRKVSLEKHYEEIDQMQRSIIDKQKVIIDKQNELLEGNRVIINDLQSTALAPFFRNIDPTIDHWTVKLKDDKFIVRFGNEERTVEKVMSGIPGEWFGELCQKWLGEEQ